MTAQRITDWSINAVNYLYVEPYGGVGGSLNYCGNCGVFYAPTVAHICSPPLLTVSPTPQATPHKCPCCDGFGQRNVSWPIDNRTAAVETCRACGGAGVLWR